MKLTSLFGKTYVWVQATQTGQWRLLRVHMERGSPRPWDEPTSDPAADILAARDLYRTGQS